jgi:spermidine synthase
MSTFAADGESLGAWLRGAEINTDRNLRLQYLAGQGLNVFAAAGIFGALAASSPGDPARLFTGTPAQVEELRQRLAGRQGRY